MKISVIITTMLVAQVSASFFDVFQGAVLSVQNSFGKLLSDVVTDVRDTVDCTILAVEHVLSLSEDATARYYDKCGSATNQTNPADTQKDGNVPPKVEVSLSISNNEEYLQKEIPAEIDARINETLSKVLGNYNTHDNILSIEKVLAKESEQLANVSDLVKQELKRLSNEIDTDLKDIKQKDSQPSVDTILQEIKLLEKREHDTRNISEAQEIHKVIDEVLDKLDVIEATEATENFKLEEILKDLENNSNNSFTDLRQQFEEWKEEESRHLGEIKGKIEEHDKVSNHTGSDLNSYKANYTQPVLSDSSTDRDDYKPILKPQEISSEHLSTPVMETSGVKVDELTTATPANDTDITSTTLPILRNTSFSEPTNTEILTTSKIHTTIESSNTITSTPQTTLAIMDALINSTVIQSNITPLPENQESSSVTNLNETTITSSSLSIIERTSEGIKPIEINTESKKEISSDLTTVKTDILNDTIITSRPGKKKKVPTKNLLNINNSSNTEISTVGYGNSSTLTTNQPQISESNDTLITSTSSFTIESFLVNDTILPIETGSTSSYKDISTEENKAVETTTKFDGENNANNTKPTEMSSQTVQNVESTTALVSLETLATTTNTKNDDGTTTATTGTPISIIDSTTSSSTSNSDINQPVESTVVENKKSTSTLNTSPALDVNNPDITSTPTSVLETTLTQLIESTTAIEIEDTQPTTSDEDETTSSEEQESSSTSTQITPQATTATETILPIEITTASRNDYISSSTPTLEIDTFLTTPNNLNMNHIMTDSPALTTTENPVVTNSPVLDRPIIPLNREWLAPRRHEPPRTNYDYNRPLTSNDRILQARPPPFDPNRAYGGYAIPGSMPNQQPYNENPMLPKFSEKPIPSVLNEPFNAGAIADSVISQLINSDDSVVIPDLVSKLINLPEPSEVKKTIRPRKPKLDTQRMNYGSLPNTRPPKKLNRPSYFGPPENTNRSPRGLTTHRPILSPARQFNNNAPMMPDYDAFFHMPQKDTAAHERALRDARQLIANSKRSDRIINSILKNKNNYGAKSLFNNPQPLNAGK